MNEQIGRIILIRWNIYLGNIVAKQDLEALASCVALNLCSEKMTRLVVHFFLGGLIGMGHETTYGDSSTMGIVGEASTL